MMLSEEDYDFLEANLLPSSGGEDTLEKELVFNLEDVPNAEKDERSAKKRRPPAPKLDLNLLLAEKGFSYLLTQNAQMVNSLSGFEGHELQDAQSIVEYMRAWHHYLYPKGRFVDFTRKIERTCRSKDAQVLPFYKPELRLI